REILVREEERFRRVVRDRKARGTEAGRLKLGSFPGAVFQSQRSDSAAHVVERSNENAVARPLHAGERHALAWLEEHTELGNAAQDVVDRAREKGPFAVRPAADGPVAAKRDEKPVVEELAQARVLGQIELHQAITEQQERLLAEKRRSSRHDVVAPVAQD